jgi:hypothetical protein
MMILNGDGMFQRKQCQLRFDRHSVRTMMLPSEYEAPFFNEASEVGCFLSGRCQRQATVAQQYDLQQARTTRYELLDRAGFTEAFIVAMVSPKSEIRLAQ